MALTSGSPRKICVTGVVLVAATGAALGTWFKSQQLRLGSELLPPFYPMSGWLMAAMLAAGLMLVLWGGTSAVARWLAGTEASVAGRRAILISAFGFVSFLVAPLSFTLALRLWLSWQCGLLGWVAWQARGPRLRRHGTALILILASSLMFDRFLGPVAWENPVASALWGESGHLGANTPLHVPNFVNVKKFDLSNYPEGYFGSIPHSPVGGFSFGMAVMTWLCDPPLVSPSAFFRLAEILCFVWSVVGSFVFYLFLTEGLQLGFFTSAVGGCAYILGNPCLAQPVTQYFPIFLGPFFTLPVALWQGRVAFREGTLRRAFLGGALFGINFYVLPSHPDALLHALAFLGLYFGFLAIVLPGEGRARRVSCLVALLAGIFLAGGRYLIPIALRELHGEMVVFGHLDAPFDYGFTAAWDRVLRFFVLCPLFPLVLASLVRVKTVFRSVRRWDLVFFLVFGAAVVAGLAPGRDNPIASWGKSHFHALSFLFPTRILMYGVLSLLVVALAGLDSILVSEEKLSWRDAVLPFGAFYTVELMARGRTEVSDWLAAFLSLVAVAIWKSPGFRREPRRLGWLATLALLIAGGKTYLSTAKYHRNAEDCAPYISLQSLALSYRAIGLEDEPSLRLMRGRFREFESRLAVFEVYEGKSSPYSDLYRKYLAKAGLGSLDEIPFPDTLAQAEALSPLVDSFELEQGCTYAPMFPVGQRPELPGFPDFNSNLLFSGVPDPAFHRILMAAGFHHFLGAWAPGFLVHNRTVTADTRFVRVYPPIQALYLKPGETFQCVGAYPCPLAWAMDITAVSNPLSRRLLEISGVDVFVVAREAFQQLKDKAELRELPVSMHPQISPPFAVVADERSNGFAYLVNRVRFVGPERGWNEFPPPLGALPSEKHHEYDAKVARVQNALVQLGKREAYLEDEARVGQEIASPSANAMTLQKVVGNKVVLKVHCEREPCFVVVNDAAVDGWRAFADGTPLPIHRANFAFLGVEVPRGDHLVWLEFYDTVEAWAGIVTLLVFFFTFACCLTGSGEARAGQPQG